MSENYPSNKTAYVGNDVTFECRFVSDLHPSMKWLRYYQVNGSWTDEENQPYVYEVRVCLYNEFSWIGQ